MGVYIGLGMLLVRRAVFVAVNASGRMIKPHISNRVFVVGLYRFLTVASVVPAAVGSLRCLKIAQLTE